MFYNIAEFCDRNLFKILNVTNFFILLASDFPSQAVVQAYLYPTIDESREKFSWGKPNMVLLSDYVRTKFGWSKTKFEDVITPVMKKIEEKETQRRMDFYLKRQVLPKPVGDNMSKRVKKAVQRLAGEVGSDDEVSEKTKKVTKRGKKVKSTEEQVGEESGNVQGENEGGEKPAKVAKRRRKTNSTEEKVEGGDETSENTARVAKRRRNTKSTDEPSVIDADVDTEMDTNPSTSTSTPADPDPTTSSLFKKTQPLEYIPQREKDKASAALKKLRAIEVFKKTRKNAKSSKKVKRVAKVTREAELSEESSSSS